jgi:transcriptional regulator with XRE-family HTH domain
LCYKDLDGVLLGKYLRQRRQELNLTLDEVARRTGLNEKNLGRIERVGQIPSGNTLFKLERVYNMKISTLFERIRKETEESDSD